MSLRGQKLADPHDQSWVDLVAAHGHAVVKVADRAGENSNDPPFAYSLGAYESYGAPELILFGLDGDIAAQIINNVMDDHRSGRRFKCGVEERGMIAGELPVVFLDTLPAKGLGYATVADWYYQRAPFPLWQLFWPARDGRFPWDLNSPAGLVAAQPDLTEGHYLGHPPRG